MDNLRGTGWALLRWILALAVGALVVACFYPILWMFLNCFRTSGEIYANVIGLPTALNFSVFAEAWTKANFGSAFYNSAYIAVLEVLIIILASSFTAYAVTLLAVRGRNVIYGTIVSLQVISGQIILIPLFVLIRNLGLINNLWANILAGATLGLPLGTMIFRGSFMAFPKDVYESSLVDGCTSLRFYFTILMPLSKAAFASVVIYEMLFSWNEYLFALTFLRNDKTRTITTATQVFFTQWQSNWTQLFAILSIALLPVLVLYLSLQKYFIAGMMAGAVKG